MTPLALSVDVAATVRLTRLVTKDVIAEPLRERVVREAYLLGERRPPGVSVDRLGRARDQDGRPMPWVDVATLDSDPPKAATFITCPWCTSVWIGLGVVAARRLVPRLWDPIARALAASHVAGLAANLDVE